MKTKMQIAFTDTQDRGLIISYHFFIFKTLDSTHIFHATPDPLV